jgi:hypothetical protein
MTSSPTRIEAFQVWIPKDALALCSMGTPRTDSLLAWLQHPANQSEIVGGHSSETGLSAGVRQPLRWAIVQASPTHWLVEGAWLYRGG